VLRGNGGRFTLGKGPKDPWLIGRADGLFSRGGEVKEGWAPGKDKAEKRVGESHTGNQKGENRVNDTAGHQLGQRERKRKYFQTNQGCERGVKKNQA